MPFLLCLTFGCVDRETAVEQETNTISPATPPNSASDDNDTPTTQTVEIGEERSPNEGGALAETATIPATPSPTSSPATGPSP